jgi:hypothetical protein
MKGIEMDWTCRMCGEMRTACNILFRGPLRKKPCGELGSRWEVNITMNIGSRFSWLSIGALVDSCEHSEEPADFIKARNFFNQRKNFQHFKEDPLKPKLSEIY